MPYIRGNGYRNQLLHVNKHFDTQKLKAFEITDSNMAETYSASYFKRKVQEEVAKIRANNDNEFYERQEVAKRFKPVVEDDDEVVYGQDDDPDRRAAFKEKLNKWAVDSATAPKHLTALLKLLADFLPFDPPKSAEALLSAKDMEKYSAARGTRGLEMSMAEMMVKMSELQKDMSQIRRTVLPKTKLKYPLTSWQDSLEGDFVST